MDEPVNPPPNTGQSAFAVRDPEIEKLMHELATKIGGMMPDNWGFCLFLFEYGEGGNLFYISSADRGDMITLLKEWMNRQTM